jgi:hypothetical protein
MTYGTIKVDTITFTSDGVDKSVAISGLVQNPTFTGNVTVTGTISGNTVRGQTISGVTVTGTTANFTSGNFTNISGGTHTITSGVFASGTAANPSISFVSDPNSGLYSPGADQVAISTNGTGRLFVNGGGLVGIGASAPSAFLDIAKAGAETAAPNSVADWLVMRGSSSAGMTLLTNTTGENNIFFGDTDNQTTGRIQYLHAVDAMRFNVNGSERLRITSDGKLGLGTSSPSYPLHVANGAVGITSFSNSIDGAGEVGLLLRGANGSHNTSLLFSSSNTNFRARQYFNVTDGALRLDTSSDGSTFTERLRVTSAGLVGIGTTSPSKNLHVAGDVRFGANDTSTVEVQIGEGATGNRTTLIDFVGDTTYTDYGLRVTRGGTGANANSSIIHRGTGELRLFNLDAGPITFLTSNTERARLDGSGRLLVGTSTARGFFNNTFTTGSQFETSRSISIVSNDSGNLAGAVLVLAHQKSGSTGGNTAVADGNALGAISFQGNNGSQFLNGAEIGAFADGVVSGGGAADLPTRLVFSTTADGASSPTERMRIDSTGNVGIGATSFTFGNGTGLLVQRETTATIRAFSNIGGKALELTATTDGAVVSARGASSFLAFESVATERARIDSSGRLLVGTSSASFLGNGRIPAIQLEDTAQGESGIGIKNNSNDAGGSFITLAKSRGTSVNSSTSVQSGDQLGNIIFAGADGTDSQSEGASIKAEVDGTPGANDMPGRLVFSTTADGASSPTERMRITNSGAVLIGKQALSATTTGIEFEAAGFMRCVRDGNLASIFQRYSSDGDVVGFRRDNTAVGSISVTPTATAYNTSSDYRLKENVVPLTGAADRLNQLQVKRFNFIADPDKTVDGFIAHEAQAVVPECVTGTKDEVDNDGNPVYQGIDQSKLVPLLTAALQEAIGRIETLEAEVTALKAS